MGRFIKKTVLCDQWHLAAARFSLRSYAIRHNRAAPIAFHGESPFSAYARRGPADGRRPGTDLGEWKVMEVESQVSPS